MPPKKPKAKRESKAKDGAVLSDEQAIHEDLTLTEPLQGEGAEDVASFKQMCSEYKVQSNRMMNLQEDMLRKINTMLSKNLPGLQVSLQPAAMPGTSNGKDNELGVGSTLASSGDDMDGIEKKTLDADKIYLGTGNRLPQTDPVSLATLEEQQSVEEIKRFIKDAERTGTVKFQEKQGILQRLESFLNMYMFFIIISNSLYIGIEMDNDTFDAPKSTKAAFAAVSTTYMLIFTVEIALQILLKGWRHYLLGPEWRWSWFETGLVTLDYVLFISRLISEAMFEMMPAWAASVIRLVRLMKVMRLLKVLRSLVFQDLIRMIHGLTGGARTLLWALVLFGLLIYILSLMFRTLFGDWQNPSEEYKTHVYPYFDSVPRAMLTTFRCAFGACSDISGTALVEWIARERGQDLVAGIALKGGGLNFQSIIMILFVFVITVGVFNVIAAIFVETTLDAAHDVKTRKIRERLASKNVWNFHMYRLTKLVYKYSHPDLEDQPETLSFVLNEILRMEVPNEIIDQTFHDPEAVAALIALDIPAGDNDYFSDILDPDNGGTITYIELYDGLKRLRGEPRRSDIISVDLMIRSVQRQVDMVWGKVRHLKEDSHGSH